MKSPLGLFFKIILMLENKYLEQLKYAIILVEVVNMTKSQIQK